MRSEKRISLLGISSILFLLCIGTKVIAAEADTLTFGFPFKSSSFSDLPVIIAQEKGFFKTEGLEVKTIRFDNPFDAFAGLAEGKVDVAGLNTVGFLEYYEAKPGNKIISSSVPGVPYFLVGDRRIKKVENLKKAKVLLRSNYQFFIMDAMMQKHELSLKDVVAIRAPMPLPQIFANLDRKEFDATLIPAYAEYELKNLKNTHRIVEVVSELPLFVYSYEISSDRVINKHPDKLNKFIKALIRSTRFLNNLDHLEEVAEIIKKLNLVPYVNRDYLRESVKAVVGTGTFSVNGGLYHDKFFEFTTDELFKFKMIKKKFKLAEVSNKEFVNKAINAMGPIDDIKGPRPCSVPAP